nr:molybdopterin-synthase adenylyltransferase MoeB [Paludibaculum fermentans]
MSLTAEELDRYSRHIMLPEVGAEGQEKLKNSKVLLVGTGGLGAPLGLYLAAAGVGTIGLVDFDTVSVSNLQRQVIHGTKDIGRRKLDSAADTLLDINPNVNIVKHEVALTSENALAIVGAYDVVADGTDNFPTRYLVNDACVLTGKPNAYGSIFRFEGQASVFATEEGPCYRCLYPEPPPPGLVPSCAEGGVLGILPGVIGLIQATEVVKLLLGIGQTLAGRLLLYDAMNMKFRELKLRKNPDCPVCGTNRTVTKLIDYHQFCGMPKEISALEVKAKLARKDDFVLIDVREPHEHQARNIPEATLIPLGQLPQRMLEIDRSKLVIVHCKSGMRSAKACTLLRESGYPNVLNMTGGIDAYPAS